MVNKDSTFTKEDEEDLFLWLMTNPTSPGDAVWKRPGFFKRIFLGDYRRVRINITKDNMSVEMKDIYTELKYNREKEPKAIMELISIIQDSCVETPIPISIVEGEETLQQGLALTFYQPYKFDLQFPKAEIQLTIPIGEIQIYITGYNKESLENKILLDRFMEISNDKIQNFVMNGYTI